MYGRGLANLMEALLIQRKDYTVGHDIEKLMVHSYCPLGLHVDSYVTLPNVTPSLDSVCL